MLGCRKMSDISVIILTKNEKLHIRRCLEQLMPLEPRQVFVVDCFSTDGTQEIVEKYASGGVVLIEHEWPGFYAKQFNWALDTLPIRTGWVLRLDADECLTPETIELLKDKLPKLAADVSGLSLELGRTFWGKPVSRGVGQIWLTRVFRYRIGRCEDKSMDEHIVVSSGHIEKLVGGKFVDDNLNSHDWWREKHRGYAKREAKDAIAGEKFKASKTFYYRCPPYLRAFAYFCYRYFLRLGFLDGYAGWQWHFWQGLWYRWLVDREIGRMKRGLST